MQFDTPQPAMVEAPPYEPEQYDVYALELNPGGDFPFKVWVKDGNPDEDKPFYATGVSFIEANQE